LTGAGTESFEASFCTVAALAVLTGGLAFVGAFALTGVVLAGALAAGALENCRSGADWPNWRLPMASWARVGVIAVVARKAHAKPTTTSRRTWIFNIADIEPPCRRHTRDDGPRACGAPALVSSNPWPMENMSQAPVSRLHRLFSGR
jgi:hypothetical protein